MQNLTGRISSMLLWSYTLLSKQLVHRKVSTNFRFLRCRERTPHYLALPHDRARHSAAQPGSHCARSAPSPGGPGAGMERRQSVRLNRLLLHR